MTKHDANGANCDEDDVRFITADSTADERIHVHNVKAKSMGKGVLVEALKAGAVLQEERNRRGDGFGDWVDKELGLSRSDAECYIRFYEESGLRTEQLSPAVEVKLPRVLELLGQLNTGFPGRDAPARHTRITDGADSSQPKPTVGTGVDNTPTQQSPKPKEVTSRPAKVSERAKKRTSKATAEAKPVQQDRDDRQSVLTAEQRQFLVRRSPRLFAQVRKGELPVEEALRLAGGLTDRSSPKRSPSS